MLIQNQHRRRRPPHQILHHPRILTLLQQQRREPVPQIMHPEIQEYKPVDEKKQPTFADGKKEIPIADAEVIQQNKK